MKTLSLPTKYQTSIIMTKILIAIFLGGLIGLFYALSARFNLSTEVRMLLTTGLCGGFTTFSTFSNDGLMLIKQGFYGLFALYTLLSILLGFFAVLGGSILGKTF